jgi:hypothetical protein
VSIFGGPWCAPPLLRRCTQHFHRCRRPILGHEENGMSCGLQCLRTSEASCAKGEGAIRRSIGSPPIRVRLLGWQGSRLATRAAPFQSQLSIKTAMSWGVIVTAGKSRWGVSKRIRRNVPPGRTGCIDLLREYTFRFSSFADHGSRHRDPPAEEGPRFKSSNRLCDSHRLTTASRKRCGRHSPSKPRQGERPCSKAAMPEKQQHPRSGTRAIRGRSYPRVSCGWLTDRSDPARDPLSRNGVRFVQLRKAERVRGARDGA